MACESPKTPLDEVQQQIFEKLTKNDTEGFHQLISLVKGGVNFVDENGMTPLQHACCKGNKRAVELLLDMGADINYNQHGANYTPLHFAALSGNKEVCRLLLDAGINPNSVNSVSRTASQMAAFVGNHACVEMINNYVSLSSLEYYTQLHGQQTEPLIAHDLLKAFHEFVIEVNLHPVRIALNLQTLGLLKHLVGVRKALELMCEKEMTKSHDINELMAFKFHYLSWIVSELVRCVELCRAQRKDKDRSDEKISDKDSDRPEPSSSRSEIKNDFVEHFIKRVLKENKQGQLDFVEFTVRECVREFPYRQCTIFRQVVSQLTAKEAQPALLILRFSINGMHSFVDDTSYCSTCGNAKPDKKCSKCKAVQYCDRECQRLHWFSHKKNCARLQSNAASAAAAAKSSIDMKELSEEIARLTAT